METFSAAHHQKYYYLIGLCGYSHKSISKICLTVSVWMMAVFSGCHLRFVKNISLACYLYMNKMSNTGITVKYCSFSCFNVAKLLSITMRAHWKQTHTAYIKCIMFFVYNAQEIKYLPAMNGCNDLTSVTSKVRQPLQYTSSSSSSSILLHIHFKIFIQADCPSFFVIILMENKKKTSG